MAENSKIEWTDHTFNPVMGCQKVSDGCKFCYAEAQMDHRYGKVQWGPQGTRQRTAVANWRKPLQWNKRPWYQCTGCGWRGQSQAVDLQSWNDGCHCRNGVLRPTRCRVFCASLADVFEDHADWVRPRADLFALIDQTPNLDWLLLTKRPENIQRLWPWGWYDEQFTWPNVWLGTSVENQEAADKRIPELLKVPAKVRFLSCEPLLGPVNLHPWICEYGNPARPEQKFSRWCNPSGAISWVIAGGESGPKARPMHPDWARGLRDQCQAAGVAFLYKQWGEWLPPYATLTAGVGYDEAWIAEVKSHLRTDVCFAGNEDPAPVWKVGKHAAGRLLDGREWNEFPNVQQSKEVQTL